MHTRALARFLCSRGLSNIGADVTQFNSMQFFSLSVSMSCLSRCHWADSYGLLIVFLCKIDCHFFRSANKQKMTLMRCWTKRIWRITITIPCWFLEEKNKYLDKSFVSESTVHHLNGRVQITIDLAPCPTSTACHWKLAWFVCLCCDRLKRSACMLAMNGIKWKCNRLRTDCFEALTANLEHRYKLRPLAF